MVSSATFVTFGVAIFLTVLRDRAMGETTGIPGSGEKSLVVSVRREGFKADLAGALILGVTEVTGVVVADRLLVLDGSSVKGCSSHETGVWTLVNLC